MKNYEQLPCRLLCMCPLMWLPSRPPIPWNCQLLSCPCGTAPAGARYPERHPTCEHGSSAQTRVGESIKSQTPASLLRTKYRFFSAEQFMVCSGLLRISRLRSLSSCSISSFASPVSSSPGTKALECSHTSEIPVTHEYT